MAFSRIILVGVLCWVLVGCQQYVVQNLLQDQRVLSKEAVELTFYDRYHQQYQLEELETWVGERLVVDEKTPLLLYLHGMGNFPSRAFRQKMFEKIKTDYGMDTLLLNWPAWINAYTIPRLNAKSSAPYLGDTLQIMKDVFAHKKQPPPVILMVHSLGAEVLFEFLKTYQAGSLPLFLKKVILINPDVPLYNHHRWLEKIDFSISIDVVVNHRDQLLKFDKLHSGHDLLGMDFFKNTEDVFTNNARYVIFDVDIDALSKKRREEYQDFSTWKFHTPHLRGNKHTKQFIARLLNDEPLGGDVKKLAKPAVYRFKP